MGWIAPGHVASLLQIVALLNMLSRRFVPLALASKYVPSQTKKHLTNIMTRAYISERFDM
jgi:hypothetical protein